jgi:hypothetical protein
MSSSEPALPAPPAAGVEHDSASETAAIPAQPPSPGPVSDAASGTVGTELEGEALMEALRRQVEFYFSKSNLQSDSFLVSSLASLCYIAYMQHSAWYFRLTVSNLAMQRPPRSSYQSALPQCYTTSI